MKREILFQGKAVTDGRWVEGFYVQHSVHQRFPEQDDPKYLRHYIMHDGTTMRGFEPPWIPTEVDPKTVRQFTGFVDRSRQKVFEGDILRVEHDDDAGYDLMVIAAHCNGCWVAESYNSIDDMVEYTGWDNTEKPFDRLALEDLCVIGNLCDGRIVGNIYDLPMHLTPVIHGYTDRRPNKDNGEVRKHEALEREH